MKAKKRTGPSPRRPAHELVVMAEREKRVLAQQLHEGLLQTLSAASILARVVTMRSRQEGKVPTEEFCRLQETIDSAIDEARMAIRQLQPPGGEEKSLVASLQDLSDSLAGKCPCEFRHNSPGARRLDPTVTLGLLRVAQETVAAARHCRELSKLEITLAASPVLLTLTVRYERRGTPGARLERKIAGDTGLEVYARWIEADLKVEHDGRSTTVCCSCPLASSSNP